VRLRSFKAAKFLLVAGVDAALRNEARETVAAVVREKSKEILEERNRIRFLRIQAKSMRQMALSHDDHLTLASEPQVRRGPGGGRARAERGGAREDAAEREGGTRAGEGRCPPGAPEGLSSSRARALARAAGQAPAGLLLLRSLRSPALASLARARFARPSRRN
jgi:hypothetical protein